MDGENMIGVRIKELRTQLGMNQTEFAQRLGGTQQQICQLERSTRNIRPAVISSICGNFNVNERWLRTGEGEMFKRETDATDIARSLQRAICQRIFDSLPVDVQDTILEICRDETAKRDRRGASVFKALELKEEQNQSQEEESFFDAGEGQDENSETRSGKSKKN